MRPSTRLSAILLAGCCAGPAFAQSLMVTETLLLSPPQDFRAGFQSDSGNRLMTEFVPSSETVEDWKQMLTVQIYRGATVDASSFLGGIGKRYTDACPGTTAKGIYTGQVNGYVVSMLLLKCPLNPGTGKPETTAFVCVRKSAP